MCPSGHASGLPVVAFYHLASHPTQQRQGLFIFRWGCRGCWAGSCDWIAPPIGALISSLKVELLLYILGPAVAMFFGTAQPQMPRGRVLTECFRSPIFTGVVARLVLSPLQLNEQKIALAPLFETCRTMEGAGRAGVLHAGAATEVGIHAGQWLVSVSWGLTRWVFNR